MAVIKFIDENGIFRYMGTHPMEKTRTQSGKKLTANDVRRNKRLARKWKMIDCRHWSGHNTSDLSGPHYEGGEYTFRNKSGHQRVVWEECVTYPSGKQVYRKLNVSYN